MIVPLPPWTSGHFIGGHPALDLANTVYDRHDPPADNELLRTGDDLAAWLRSQELIEGGRVAEIARIDAAGLAAIWSVREDAFAVLDALAADAGLNPGALGRLHRGAGDGFARGALAWSQEAPGASAVPGVGVGDLPSLLSAIVLDAVHRLPPDRLRSCARCGWLFADLSRGNKRRWCSMSVCGNREKAIRHRTVARG